MAALPRGAGVFRAVGGGWGGEGVEHDQQPFGQFRVGVAADVGGPVRPERDGQVAEPVDVGLIGQGAVRVEMIQMPAPQLRQRRRVIHGGGGDQVGLDPPGQVRVLGHERGRDPFDRVDHHPRMRGRDGPVGLRRRRVGERGFQRLAGRAPGADRGPRPLSPAPTPPRARPAGRRAATPGSRRTRTPGPGPGPRSPRSTPDRRRPAFGERPRRRAGDPAVPCRSRTPNPEWSVRG